MSGTQAVSVVNEKQEDFKKGKEFNTLEHTALIACFNIHKFLVLSTYYIYVFRVNLRTNTDHSAKSCQPIYIYLG